MCGLTGIIYTNSSNCVDETTLIQMRDVLMHRGPDDAGIFISKDKKVGFGFRRLKIIDLSKEANEPLFNEDKSLVLVFNGEIYNFQELRNKLLKHGHKFQSQTDSEVILHLYEEKKEKLLDDLDGMFAFALWDENNHILFCARDRLGIKPFYYYFQNGIFIFGSEIKSILQHPSIKKELNIEAISHYLDFLCVPAPLTLFKNINKLNAAHYLILYKSNLTTQQYWNPFVKLQEYQNKPETFYITKTRELLENSIKKQMVADVPFGCFLSGGIDSSTNAILMSRTLGTPVKTFTSYYEDETNYNEIKYANEIVDLLKSDNYQIKLTKQNFLDWLNIFVQISDDPNGDPVSFPIYYLSKLAQEHNTKMIQVGEGADEIFCGYKSYLYYVKLWKIFWRYSKHLSLPKHLPFNLMETLFAPSKRGLQQELVRRLAYKQPLFFGGAHGFYTYEKPSLFTKRFQKLIDIKNSDNIIQNYYKTLQQQNPTADFTMQMLFIELNLRLPELLLMRVDKMSMINSIEVRVPFLDHNLVELASCIPLNLKIKNNTSKYILKKSLKNIVPDNIIKRKKQGFDVPIKEWLRPQKTNDISKLLIEFINNSRLKNLDIIDYKYVQRMISNHQYKNRNYSLKLYNLMTLSLWYDYWFK